MKRVVSLALLIVATQAGCLAAEPPRLTRIRGFVESFNQGDPEGLIRFLEENAEAGWLAAHREDLAVELAELIDSRGPLQLTGVAFVGEAVATLHALSDRVEENVLVELVFEKTEPYRIVGFGIDLTPDLPHDLPPPPPLTGEPPAIRAALESYFADLTATGKFSGVVLLRRQGETIFSGAYGWAERRWKQPNRTTTRFVLGSINKAFTKVAIAQLVAAGRLSFGDTLLEMLPDYPNPKVAKKITLAHLLEHRSGLGDIFGPEFAATDKGRLRTDRDYFPLFANRPLEFEPGSSQRYSNAGYIVLGAIVTEVSGTPYPEYVEAKIFEPAGMRGADFAAVDGLDPDVATGYTRFTPDHDEDAPLRSNVYLLPSIGMGAGGAVATAEDLAAFDRALRTHRLLDPRYTEWFFTGELPEEVPGEPVRHPIGIAGGGPGVNAILEGDGEHTVVLLVNLDPPLAETLGIALSRELRKSQE